MLPDNMEFFEIVALTQNKILLLHGDKYKIEKKNEETSSKVYIQRPRNNTTPLSEANTDFCFAAFPTTRHWPSLIMKMIIWSSSVLWSFIFYWSESGKEASVIKTQTSTSFLN